MNALAVATADQVAGWVLIVGTLLMAFGWIVLNLGCSAWAELREARRSRAAESSSPVPFVDPVAAYQATWDQHVADALRATEEASGLSPVGDVIPMQRDGRRPR